jgi:DNA-binding LytR/AlgR family response regulator
MKSFQILGHKGRLGIAPNDIVYLEAAHNYTTLHMECKTQHTMSFTLRKVEQRLASADFLRINRGLSINRNYLEGVSSMKNDAFVRLSNGMELPVSRRRYKEVKKIIVNNFNK